MFVLRDAGWHVNDKRVERLWRREGLSDLFILRGVPLYIRSELPIEGAIGSSPMGDGSELAAQAVQDWIKAVGAKTAYIEPGAP